MASTGKQKVHATRGVEEEAGRRYTRFRELIRENSSEPFQKVVTEIAGLSSPGSYYNYTAPNSQKYGHVSLQTVEALKDYFRLPIGVFDCSIALTPEHEQQIAKKIRQDYGDDEEGFNTGEFLRITKRLLDLEDLDSLNKAIPVMEATLMMAKGQQALLQAISV